MAGNIEVIDQTVKAVFIREEECQISMLAEEVHPKSQMQILIEGKRYEPQKRHRY